jgi:hypothetical protein
MLNVVVLSVVMLNVIMLSVIAPLNLSSLIITTGFYNLIIKKSLTSLLFLSCRILEHFAILPGLVNELLKLRSALHSKAPFWHQKYVDLPSTARCNFGNENKRIRLPHARPHFGPRKMYPLKPGSSTPDPDPCIILLRLS